MIGSDFNEASLDGITIAGGDWSYTNLRFANLSKQAMRGIRLVEADLYSCNLEKADLRDADLTRARMGKSRMQGADLRGALMDGVDFMSLDIKGARMDAHQGAAFLRAYGAKVDD